MNATTSEDCGAAADHGPDSHERPTFSLRAAQLREAAREAANGEVQRIREHAERNLQAMRQQHALELAVAEEKAQRRGIPWWLPLGVALLGLVALGGYSLLDRHQLSEDPTWTFTWPETDVRLAVVVSDGRAERELAVRRSSPTGPQTSRSNTKTTRRTCSGNAFDPLNDCL